MKTPRKKESAAHKRLAEELVSLLPDLDEEGLAFLVEQARVHLYNMEVDRLSREAPPREDAPGKSRAAAGEPAVGGPSAGPANFRIDRSASGTSYHLISGGNWKMYNEAEMMRIVKIASGPGSEREAAPRLYAWFERERPDTFADLGITGPADSRMAELVLFLRSKFAIKTKP